MKSSTLLSAIKNFCLVEHTLLEPLFDHTSDIAFFIKNANGRYTTVNHTLVERYGFTRKSQLIGCKPREICPRELRNLLTEQDSQVTQYDRSAFTWAFRAATHASPTEFRKQK